MGELPKPGVETSSRVSRLTVLCACRGKRYMPFLASAGDSIASGSRSLRTGRAGHDLDQLGSGQHRHRSGSRGTREPTVTGSAVTSR